MHESGRRDSADRRRAGRLVVPSQQAPADRSLLERSAIEELSHHADPWRVLRILSEFVEGFDALNEVGPAVTVFVSARAKHDDPYYKAGRSLGAALAQTGKIEHFPIVLFGSPYWRGLLEWLQDHVLASGAIAPDDLKLMTITDDPDEAAEMATRPLPVRVEEPREQTGEPKADAQ